MDKFFASVVCIYRKCSVLQIAFGVKIGFLGTFICMFIPLLMAIKRALFLWKISEGNHVPFGSCPL